MEIGAKAALFPEQEYISGIFVAVEVTGSGCLKSAATSLSTRTSPFWYCIGGAAAMHGTLHGIGRQNLGRGGVDLGGKQVRSPAGMAKQLGCETSRLAMKVWWSLFKSSSNVRDVSRIWR